MFYQISIKSTGGYKILALCARWWSTPRPSRIRGCTHWCRANISCARRILAGSLGGAPPQRDGKIKIISIKIVIFKAFSAEFLLQIFKNLVY